MSLFAVTFRINDTDSSRYARVYDDLNDAIVAVCEGSHWADPTSFYLISSDKNSADLADAILKRVLDFDAARDLVVVINLSKTKGHAAKGHIVDKDFTALMASR